MKISAVILNYNDAQGTVDAMKRVDGFLCFDNIIIVDNASPDNSAERIEKAAAEIGNDRITVLRAQRNGGYGYGNNFGIRYAYEKCGADLALIANPDAFFSEQTVKDMAAVFEVEKDAAAVGAVMHNGSIETATESAYQHSGWKRRGVFGSILNGGPVMRRLCNAFLNYPIKHYMDAEKYVGVYAVHGSMLMVDCRKFIECGTYDENMFLYGEENVIAEKFFRAGYKTFLLKECYRHLGSQSITGSGLGAVRRQKLRNQSENYFYRNYLNAGNAAMFSAHIFQRIVLAETALAAKLGVI